MNVRITVPLREPYLVRNTLRIRNTFSRIAFPPYRVDDTLSGNANVYRNLQSNTYTVRYEGKT